jgi:hypothetical protein
MVRDSYKLSFLYNSRDHAKIPKHANATGSVSLCELSTKSQGLATWQQAGFLLGWFSSLNSGVLRSSETLFHVRTTRRDIPENGNFQT